MWPAIEALAGKPVLIVRGALSDLLSQATLDAMLARLPQGRAVTVQGVGHAPLLTEPEVLPAIEELIARAG
jgi:pimeloyl-ACP methyl ester carboxylesterase